MENLRLKHKMRIPWQWMKAFDLLCSCFHISWVWECIGQSETGVEEEDRWDNIREPPWNFLAPFTLHLCRIFDICWVKAAFTSHEFEGASDNLRREWREKIDGTISENHHDVSHLISVRSECVSDFTCYLFSITLLCLLHIQQLLEVKICFEWCYWKGVIKKPWL